MTKLGADCLNTDEDPIAGKASQSGIFWWDCDAMQAKKKKLARGVSMKKLKGTHFEVELQEKVQRVYVTPRFPKYMKT